ncbi:MAG: aspartate aminotransferase family protein [Bacillota bacterium]|jgi:putrescine aminotransferase|nr:aspartate aminotransferase family protein [Bacillota bacterium]HOB90999.1 aspartate aminotransferase family protein [Bacillota bacterium]HPZ54125.1 aspartate aminotransferase family protein [Bacillota bacterium]HQD18488.1 aspartate aminotransferase family protein [Bacillota bacterium]
MKLLTIDDAINMTRSELRKLYADYVNPAYVRLLGLVNIDRHFVRASGVSIWDEDGMEYYDFLGGFGSLNFGHNPVEVFEAIERVKQSPSLIKADLNPFAAVLAHNLAQILPGDLSRSFFCNSGTEAVEGALKTARIATSKPGIVYCNGSFHGKSMGALSVTGRVKYQRYFEPLIPECHMVQYGDIEDLERVLQTDNIAAFIVEPIQGEGGIIVPPEGYLKQARELCTRHGVLMIVDEIQTGFGRTGKLFACLEEDVVPDIICLSKSLSAGVIPIGAFVTTPEIWDRAYGTMETALLHTSTFGGNTFACAAGMVAIQLAVEKNVSDNAREMGEVLINGLRELASKYSLIKEVRGRGLMVGVEFAQPEGLANRLTGGLAASLSHEYVASLVAGELLNKHRIVTAYTLNNPNVIRLEPPLIVERYHIDALLNALDEILSRNKGLLGLAVSTAKTAVKSLFKRK